ncbi:MAG: hypothetical protein RJA34_2456 [Pseudomonadota bacterium]|jgi:DNA-binding NarL/FixJ family response regulator
MKILTVDDHALVREGLRQVLKSLDEDVHMLGAGNGAAALALADEHPDIDLVLLDFHLPDMNGLAVLDLMGKRHPALPVLMLSGSADLQLMREVLNRGAAGFITKSGLSDELLTALRRVLDGHVYTPTELTHTAPAPSFRAAKPVDGPSLTPRQEEVLLQLMQGRSNKDISRELAMSEETVKNHVSNVLRAFEAQNRTQVVALATRLGYHAGGLG